MTPPWILLHGFTGTVRSWTAVLDALDDRAAAHPLPLFGHAPETAHVEVSDFEAEVDRLAEAIGAIAASVRICGYSLGGRLALGLLARHPARFTEAVLIGAHPGLRTAEERRARSASDDALAAQLERDGLAAFVDHWEALPLFATQRRLPRARRQAQRAERLVHDAGALARSLRVLSLGRMPAYQDRLRSIHIPVTLVTGALDEKFSALASRMVPLFFDARHEAIPGVGHNVVLERPGAIAELLAGSRRSAVTAGSP